ncbi:GNAT family N-acetyltransferase [Halotia wernerae UHCC 0503]|nr:GNAT family N-acetyltransferase [Halotia wernerae UHCC 0503]
MTKSNLPAKASDDAIHIALATVNSLDYLLTWNCKQIANAQIQKKLLEICSDFGYTLPISRRCVLPLDYLSFWLKSFSSSTYQDSKVKIGSCNLLSNLMEQIVIARVLEFELDSINSLVEESLAQGFRFLERLIQEYRSGLNRFDQPGEMLFTASVQDVVVGIGGLNRDPYCGDPHIGRLRHLYVESVWRRHGVGRLLVTQLIHEANQNYQLLRLRTDTQIGDIFYQKLGFKTHPTWEHTTHHLQLGKTTYYPLS